MAGNWAAPHGLDIDGKVTLMSNDFNWSPYPYRPAGAAFSTTADMVRYVQLELGKGMLDGKRVVSEANLLERRKPQVRVSDELSYGMGLLVGTANDVPVVTHNGGTAGFSTDYFWLPEHGVGVVIVSNVGGSDVFVGAVRRRIYEALFDGEARAETDLARRVEEHEKDVATELAQVKMDVDPAWLAPLLGAWSTPGLGRVELSVKGGKLIVDAGEWRVAAGEKLGKDGTHAIETTGAPFAGVELVPEQREGKWVLVLHDPQRDYVFEKLAK
jgi:hypothetical protein